MTIPQPDFGEFYERLGRIVSMASQLQAVVGSIPYFAAGGSESGFDWIVASGGVGKVDKAMTAFLGQHPDDEDLPDFMEKVRTALAERNDIAHSVIVAGDPTALREEHRVPWLIQTRNGARREMPTAKDTDRLLEQMGQLVREGVTLAERYRPRD